MPHTWVERFEATERPNQAFLRCAKGWRSLAPHVTLIERLVCWMSPNFQYFCWCRVGAELEQWFAEAGTKNVGKYLPE
jgi:hypothetical protein